MRRAARRGQGAFTLLEVLAAMALITFVIGGVYSICGASVELGRSMSDSRVTETRITNFLSTWRDYFESLPPDIEFSAGMDLADRGGAGAILIEGGPAPFAWHPAVRLADAVELGVESSGEGQQLMVRHLQQPERSTRPGDYEVMAEMVLLKGLEKMHWQFFEPEEEKWFNNWNPEERSAPPLFLRMQFQFQDDPRLHEHVFWIANDLQEAIDPAAAPAQPQQPGAPGTVPGQPLAGQPMGLPNPNVNPRPVLNAR